MTELDIIDFLKNGFALQFRPLTETWRVKRSRDIRFAPGALCRKLKEAKKIEHTGTTGPWQVFAFTNAE